METAAEEKLKRWLAEAQAASSSGPQGATSDLYTRVSAAIRQLEDGLVERSTEARILLLAALCGEHVLFLGPPGTAKSLLARRLVGLTSSAGGFFERLLTKFSVPEELFGPLSLKGLEQDQYVRQTRGYLPEATVAFVDEIFKANSAILNSLLSIVNERVFDNGSARTSVPLRCLVAASNEPPESEELDALFDRLLFRLDVQPVSDKAVGQLIAAATSPTQSGQEAKSLPVSLEEAEEVKRAAIQVEVPPEVVEVLRGARRFLAAMEPPGRVSDRRLGQAARMLQVAAWTCGRSRVAPADCALLRHVLWTAPSQLPALKLWLSRHLVKSRGRQVSAILNGLVDRAEAGRSPAQEVVRELGAFRAVLVSELQGILSQEEVLRSHLWLDPADSVEIWTVLEQQLSNPASGGARALLLEVARLEAAAELGKLPDYIRQRRAEGGLRWTGATSAGLEGLGEETFTVGKHKGQTFSEVANNDEDYCRMVERKVADGAFSKDTPLDRQIRDFVTFLRARR